MKSTQSGLQQAVSVIFALVAVVPLLLFTWTLYVLDVIGRLEAQVSLGLALGVALLGFSIFRALLARMSELVRSLGSAVEQASRQWGAEPASAPLRAADPPVHGIGNIRELDEMARTMALLWKQEAEAHVGRPVLVSVANAAEPIAGTLAEVTDDGLLLERGSTPVAVNFSRVRAIEPDRNRRVT